MFLAINRSIHQTELIWSINRGQAVNMWGSESSCSSAINWISISSAVLLVNSLIAQRRKGTRDCSSWHALWYFQFELVSSCDIHHLLSAKQVIYILSLPGAPLFIKWPLCKSPAEDLADLITKPYCERFGFHHFQEDLGDAFFMLHQAEGIVALFSPPTVTLRDDSTVG